MPIAALHFFFSHAALAVSDTNERGAALKAPAAALEARRIKEMLLEKPTDARARRRHQCGPLRAQRSKALLKRSSKIPICFHALRKFQRSVPAAVQFKNCAGGFSFRPGASMLSDAPFGQTFPAAGFIESGDFHNASYPHRTARAPAKARRPSSSANASAFRRSLRATCCVPPSRPALPLVWPLRP